MSLLSKLLYASKLVLPEVVVGLAVERKTPSPGTTRVIWEEHMQQNLLKSGQIGNPNTWKYFYWLLGRIDDLLALSSFSPWKIKSIYDYVPYDFVIYLFWVYLRCKGVRLALFVNSRASAQNNFGYISKGVPEYVTKYYCTCWFANLFDGAYFAFDILKLCTHLHTSSGPSETLTCWTEIHYSILLLLRGAWV